jgi:hypothetical protein
MDKYRGITKLPLAESRIKHLLGRLASNRATGSYQTQQELVRAYADICFRVLEGFEKRVYDLPRAVKGTPINEENINLYLLGVYSEILYLMDAVRGTAEMAEQNFNFAVSSIRKLQSGLKNCTQQLSTYSIYATQFDNTLHFGETFSNENNIDRGSDFLGQDECFIDTAEGTISLPRLEEVDEWKIKNIQIGANSNGVLGNNVEDGVPVRGTISSMYDGNIDTWTEYEYVSDVENEAGLKLELKISLEDVQPINGIKIHPVFLGARTPLVIRALDVSQDGRQWISLKEDIRVADFLDEDPEYRYHLSPHSSRFAGEFNITFAPRFVKFIRILIKQTSSFPIIDTYSRQLLRYAIAIKEIKIYGHKYSSSGELVSKIINFTQDIAALGILSLVDPPFLPKEVGGAEYFISFDDGASWEQTTTLEEASLDIPEILYPPDSTSSIRYKLRLSKDELAFAQETRESLEIPFNERFSWSQRRPFNLNLLHTPIEGSITVCDPEVATRGRVYPRPSIGNGVVSSLVLESGTTYRRHGNTQLKLRLPLNQVKDPSTVFLYINNSVWSKVASISDFANQWSTEYVISRSSDDTWEAIFGNGDAETPKGSIPTPSDNISIYLTEENCVVEGITPPYKLKLDYPSDGVKENTLVRFHGGVYEASSETIPGGVNRFKLQNSNILINQPWQGLTRQVNIAARLPSGLFDHRSISYVEYYGDASATFKEYKGFVDGDSELTSAGDWTVDGKEGILYAKTATSSALEYSIKYWWEDVIDLETFDWDYINGKLDEIEIYETGYKTKDAEYILGSDLGAVATDTSVTILDIDSQAIKGIVAKSLRVQDGLLNGYRAFEVPFIDGRLEFLGRARVQDETIPSITSAGNSIASFRVTHWQDLVITSSPFFNDPTPTYFKAEKANLASCTTQGDFFFDVTGTESAGVGYLYIHMGGASVTLPTGYTISYQYTDEFALERMKGSYSIDPTEGILYFSEQLTAADILKRIRFKYTPYRAQYNISTQLREDRDYEVDIDGKLIRILSGANGSTEKNLSVNYKYQPDADKTLDLAPYFSPLVRALDIKVS